MGSGWTSLLKKFDILSEIVYRVVGKFVWHPVKSILRHLFRVSILSNFSVNFIYSAVSNAFFRSRNILMWGQSWITPALHVPVSLMKAIRRWHPLSYLYLSCRQGGDGTLCPTCIPHAGKEEMSPSVLPVSLMQAGRRWHPLYPSCRQGGEDSLCPTCIPYAGKEKMTPSVLPVSLMQARKR